MRCPEEMSSPRSVGHAQDFETGAAYGEGGQRTGDVEPFCGRTSMKNPVFLFQAKDERSRINAVLHSKVSRWSTSYTI